MHIGLVAVVVQDYDSAIGFFVGAPGFELVEDSPSVTNDGRPKRWVVVRPPGATTGLLLARADGDDQVAVIGRQAAGRVGFFLQVEDFDAACARMTAAGVQFVTPPRSELYGRVAIFLDIAGNRWDLIGPARGSRSERKSSLRVGSWLFQRHTLAMRSISWPGARPALAAMCAALCLAVAACSGSGSAAASPSAHPSHTASAAPTQPTSGPAAIAAITANWETLFNGAVAVPRRLALLQNGQQFAAFVHSQAKTSLGSLVLEASAKVSSVKLEPPGRADVVYTILLGGKPLEKNLHGTAVYTDGSWEVATATFCDLLRLAYGKTSHLIPAACGS